MHENLTSATCFFTFFMFMFVLNYHPDGLIEIPTVNTTLILYIATHKPSPVFVTSGLRYPTHRHTQAHFLHYYAIRKPLTRFYHPYHSFTHKPHTTTLQDSAKHYHTQYHT